MNALRHLTQRRGLRGKIGKLALQVGRLRPTDSVRWSPSLRYASSHNSAHITTISCRNNRKVSRFIVWSVSTPAQLIMLRVNRSLVLHARGD